MNRRRLVPIGFLLVLSLTMFVESVDAQLRDAIKIPRQSGDRTPSERRELLNSFRQGFNAGSQKTGTKSISLYVGIFILVAVTGGLIAWSFYRRHQSKTAVDSPRYLFTELARVHELTWVERQFLLNFADESDLEDPLPLFIEPQYFLSALDNDRYQESHRTIAYLLKKLFDIERGDFRVSTPSPKRTHSVATTILLPPR